MQAAKQFKTYEEQVKLLVARGMNVGDQAAAAEQLEKVNYYRLSGYWYPFRKLGTTRGDPGRATSSRAPPFTTSRSSTHSTRTSAPRRSRHCHQ